MSENRLCVMLDCSRNAVMKVEKVKEYISLVQKLGYNSVMLYLEDTYEITGQPFFGYLRGRYTKKELKEMDAFANSVGVELIPCIQTLAHLNAIFRWGTYAEINDIADVLLADCDKTYKLIEGMFDTVSECFTSRTINVGLDEAHLLGRGKYLDNFGFKDRFDIFCAHLDKVCKIATDRGFTPILWSDTFFERSSDNVPYKNLNVPQKAKNNIPKNAQLVCWDYYHTEKAYYDQVLSAHKQFSNRVWYACSAYASRGFAPNNAFSISSIKAAMQSCREQGIKDVIVTMWGGNGAECSLFSTLPALFYAAQAYNGNYDQNDIAEKFKAITGEDYFAFMSLDLPNDVGVKGQNYGPSKYMLYNDIFSGIYDCTIKPEYGAIYADYAKKLLEVKIDSNYGYIFDTLSKLCRVLEVKIGLGYRVRAAYTKKDKDLLNKAVVDCEEVLVRLQDFYEAFKFQWFTDNKPHGFDVQDIRLGGLMQRVKSCAQRLKDYIDGKIDKIDELEEKLIDIENGTENFTHKVPVINDWKNSATVNIL